MLANPLAKFTRPRAHVATVTRAAYEHRSVAIIPAGEAEMMDPRQVARVGPGYTYRTRSHVAALVERGEMRWCDRHHNTATFTAAAAGTWQKTQSGPVATMQWVVGAKGRYVPATQREPEMVLA